MSSQQNKLKKIKEKYKDQDEEDRELMMQLLGVGMTRHTVVTAQCAVIGMLIFIWSYLIDNLIMSVLLSQLVPLRKRKIRGRRERRGRGKRSPSGNQPLRNNLRSLVLWRSQSRLEGRVRRELPLSKRTR